MEVDQPLNHANFVSYALSQYDNRACHSSAEFHEDLKRFKYIKKLVTRYQTTGVLKERLILNHIIILYNVFGPIALTRMIFLKMTDQIQYLKPFLILMEILPERVQVDDLNIVTDDVPMDQGVIDALRRIREDSGVSRNVHRERDPGEQRGVGGGGHVRSLAERDPQTEPHAETGKILTFRKVS